MIRALKIALSRLFGREEPLTEFQTLVFTSVVEHPEHWDVDSDCDFEVKLRHKELALEVTITRFVQVYMFWHDRNYTAEIVQDRNTPSVKIDGEPAEEMFDAAKQEYFIRREAMIEDWTAEASAKLKDLDAGGVTK